MSVLVNDVTPMIPDEGVTATTGAIPVTVTLVADDVEPLKFGSPPYFAEIEFVPNVRAVVL